MTPDTRLGDTVLEQVNRILRSETFRHADALRRLFEYLVQKSLSGEAAHLKEYSIGLDVFGKPKDYDPQKDASVRIQTSKLRQKLEEYYRKEGQEDPIRIEFPKGRFELHFAPKPPPASPALPALRYWKLAALLLAATWAITAVVFVSIWATRKEPLTPAQRAIWKPFLTGERPVLVCMGAPLFIKDSTGFYRSPSINRWEDLQQLDLPSWLKPQILSGDAIPAHIYTGVGDAMAATEVARLLTIARVPFVARRSNALQWEELVHNHIVFLGPPKYTPRINEIPIDMELVMEGNRIINLRPRPGEPEVLQGNWPKKSPYVTEDYALISRLPGLYGRTRYFILSASSTEGTAAAALFVTDPGFAAELVRRVSNPKGGMPEFFQAVIHARFRAMVPVEISVRFHHELKMRPQPSAPVSPSLPAKN